MQSKFQSLLESCVNILIGYSVAVVSQIIIFPWFGIVTTVSDNLWIGAWFTVISLVRSYFVRRFFNWVHYERSGPKTRDSRCPSAVAGG